MSHELIQRVDTSCVEGGEEVTVSLNGQQVATSVQISPHLKEAFSCCIDASD